MSKKWNRMTKNKKLDVLRDEVNKLKRHAEGTDQSEPEKKKKAKKRFKVGEEPFSS